MVPWWLLIVAFLAGALACYLVLFLIERAAAGFIKWLAGHIFYDR